MATGGSKMEEVRAETGKSLEVGPGLWGSGKSSPVRDGAGSGPGPGFEAPKRGGKAKEKTK